MRGKRTRSAGLYPELGITPAGAGKTATSTRDFDYRGDHPRRCGENQLHVHAITDDVGSPPQVRGKHACGMDDVDLAEGSPPQVRGKLFNLLSIIRKNRITPAGAGKTIFLYSFLSKNRDHPRRCGENKRIHALPVHGMGSPPQVRGKRTDTRRSTAHCRITPAGAGKTAVLVNSCGREKDHPRRCGENATDFTCLLRRHRITPAGAGKTFTSLLRHNRFKDHPRRCGENNRMGEKDSRQLGSPPQVRGKQDRCFSAGYYGGITPAGAGKTYSLSRRHTWNIGSPPQVRGKLSTLQATPHTRRITPAGAGKTGRHRDFYSARQDHPRRCGENLSAPMLSMVKSGSPPQVRGKH